MWCLTSLRQTWSIRGEAGTGNRKPETVHWFDGHRPSYRSPCEDHVMARLTRVWFGALFECQRGVERGSVAFVPVRPGSPFPVLCSRQ